MRPYKRALAPRTRRLSDLGKERAWTFRFTLGPSKSSLLVCDTEGAAGLGGSLAVLFLRMVVGDTEDFLRGRPVSHTNLYKEEHRTHDEYQFRIKDKVRSGGPARQAAPLPL